MTWYLIAAASAIAALVLIYVARHAKPKCDRAMLQHLNQTEQRSSWRDIA